MKKSYKELIRYNIINMVNYHDGKIYKIICDSQPEKVYIGSTTQTLHKRLSKHVWNYKAFLDGKGNNVTSFDILKNNDYQILLIENVSCESKEELLKKEGEWIRTYKNNDELEECINKCIAGRTYKEYCEDNKDKIKEYLGEYYKKNKDKDKEYRENNKDKILKQKKLYRENNKDKIKEYRETNKDKIQQKRKEEYEKNKENHKIKVNCEYCNCNIRKGNIKKHQQSKKCKSFQ